jgi:hypothetical protein
MTPEHTRFHTASVRRTLLRSLLLLVLAVSAVAAVPAAAAADAGVGIDPGEISGLPPLGSGESTTVTVSVRNPGTSEASYRLLAQPLQGVPELPVEDAWFTFEPSELTLGPGEAQEVTVTLTLPDEVTAGDHLALLTAQLVTEGSGQGGAQVAAAVATKFFFTVSAPTEVAGVTALPEGGDDGGGVPSAVVIVGAVVGAVAVVGGGILLAGKAGLSVSVTRKPGASG